MLDKIRDLGVKSDYCYAAGLASIGVSFAAHYASRSKDEHTKAQADRWGIFVGQWPPTFFALGNALKLAELR